MKGLLGVLLFIKVGRSQVLGAVKRKFAISPHFFRNFCQSRRMSLDLLGQAKEIVGQDLADIVRSRRIDAGDSEQSLKTELDQFLGLPNDIGKTLAFEKDFERRQSMSGSSQIVGRQIFIFHFPLSSPNKERRLSRSGGLDRLQ